MQKIKILTDSGSDVRKDIAEQLNIEILRFNVNVDGKDYRDGEDFTTEEFYDMVENSTDLPKTAQIMPDVFEETFKKFYDEGFTDIIYYSLASIGSGTYFNAVKAKDSFFENNPGAGFNIHIIDSKAYSGCYGSAVINAAKKVQKGIPISEITEYLKEWADCVEVFFAPYSLKYVRKSGRISAAAAFAGELLGLRPIIGFVEAVSIVPAKVRGDKNIIPAVIKLVKEKMIPQTPYYLLIARTNEYTKELEEVATKTFGYPPEQIFQVGATIASHAGPSLVGITYRGTGRRPEVV
jgi:DegV family protein with EDD domain